MKLKRLTYLFAFALLLSNCTSTDVDTDVSDELDVDGFTDMAISFSGTVTSDDVETKGVAITSEAEMGTIGIYSYTTSGTAWANVNSGTTVTPFFNDYNMQYPLTMTYVSDNDAWDYGYTRYWPSDGTLLNFYAWSPAGRINNSYYDGRPHFSHTMSSNAVDNFDLLWAPAQVDLNYDDTSDGTKGQVHFDFSHALSRISLYARVMVTSIEDDPNNIFYYERFGINGITFYDVVGEADVTYDTTSWKPSWVLNTEDDYTRVDITASQGNTLLDHANSIRTTTGQVPKVYESAVNSEDFTNDGETVKATYANVMKVEGTQTHGIFLYPQSFASAGDSPDATMRVRIRHYDNEFCSPAEAVDLIKAAGNADGDDMGDYLLYVLCNDDGDVAVIPDNASDDTDIVYVDVDDFIGNETSKNYTLYASGYQCVAKDTVGDIYTTADLPLDEVFTVAAGFTDNTITAGQHINLYFTFDLTSAADIVIPMSVEAEVYPWTYNEIETEVYDQLVVYTDDDEITTSGTAYYYTKCSDEITINSVTADSGITVESYTEYSGTGQLTHSFTYSGATAGSTATVEIAIKKSNGQVVTKEVKYNVVSE